jgi:hypothetical protein
MEVQKRQVNWPEITQLIKREKNAIPGALTLGARWSHSLGVQTLAASFKWRSLEHSREMEVVYDKIQVGIQEALVWSGKECRLSSKLWKFSPVLLHRLETYTVGFLHVSFLLTAVGKFIFGFRLTLESFCSKSIFSERTPDSWKKLTFYCPINRSHLDGCYVP